MVEVSHSPFWCCPWLDLPNSQCRIFYHFGHSFSGYSMWATVYSLGAWIFSACVIQLFSSSFAFFLSCTLSKVSTDIHSLCLLCFFPSVFSKWLSTSSSDVPTVCQLFRLHLQCPLRPGSDTSLRWSGIFLL